MINFLTLLIIIFKFLLTLLFQTFSLNLTISNYFIKILFLLFKFFYLFILKKLSFIISS